MEMQERSEAVRFALTLQHELSSGAVGPPRPPPALQAAG